MAASARRIIVKVRTPGEDEQALIAMALSRIAVNIGNDGEMEEPLIEEDAENEEPNSGN